MRSLHLRPVLPFADPGGRPAYWAFGPNARPTGARTRSLRLRHVPPFAGPGGGRRIGPLAHTLGLQERGRAPFAFAPCCLLNRTRKNVQ